MPGILDPGYNLINLAIKNNIPITVIPGACAFINALVLSGKPAHEFFFAGFLPNRKIARQNRLKKLKALQTTLVLYESCHRIKASLEDILEVFGNIDICVAREITKKFEEIKRDKAKKIIEAFERAMPKGEFVIII